MSEYGGAIPAFLTIAIEPATFDAYFGYMRALRDAGVNCKGIPMSRDAPTAYGYQILAKSETHVLDYAELTNLVDGGQESPEHVADEKGRVAGSSQVSTSDDKDPKSYFRKTTFSETQFEVF